MCNKCKALRRFFKTWDLNNTVLYACFYYCCYFNIVQKYVHLFEMLLYSGIVFSLLGMEKLPKGVTPINAKKDFHKSVSLKAKSGRTRAENSNL